MTERHGIEVLGTVQGVGFRPFVVRIASAHGLTGCVRNTAMGVTIEVQGGVAALVSFREALESDGPPAARITHVRVWGLPSVIEQGFCIAVSEQGGATAPVLPADLATCAACIEEIETPSMRRFRYPFTNCTQCGPRYTIVLALPYDRSSTSMAEFPLCGACRLEATDIGDRRFHAQPIACPLCGPVLTLRDGSGSALCVGDAALLAAADRIGSGEIVAVKGLGGFHLVVDAANGEAIAKLRKRKHREHKPFAVMFASLTAVRASCTLSDEEAHWLTSAAAPALLLARLEGAPVAAGVAPGNPDLAVLLPNTPLHHLLLSAVGRAVVCTSANVTGEPMVVSVAELIARLPGVADAVLDHNRPVVRPVDDTVGRVVDGTLRLTRRARGFSPVPCSFPMTTHCILAVGGHLKATVAVARDGNVVVSQHLGDLGSFDGALGHERCIDELCSLFGTPDLIACEARTDLPATRLAERVAATLCVPLVRVQHHHAHVAAVIAEYGLVGPVLGLAWDGAGLGEDGVLWGGEALVVDGVRCERVAHLRPFGLAGGEAAMRQPLRSLFGLWFELEGQGALERVPLLGAHGKTLLTMLQQGVNAPQTTSMGRLFDAVAALTGLCIAPTFEGHAAMSVQHAAAMEPASASHYAMPLQGSLVDWGPMLRQMAADRDECTAGQIARRFHASLAVLAGQIAVRAGVAQVALSGGCFQNPLLLTAVTARLGSLGFAVYAPSLYPANDGGLALGQAWVAAQEAGNVLGRSR